MTIDGIKVVVGDDGRMFCFREDFIKVTNNRSEEDFCNWCDDNNFIAVG